MGGKKKKTITAMEKESLRKKREKVEVEKKKKEEKEIRRSTIPASVDTSIIENIRRNLNNTSYLTPFSIYSKYGLKMGDAKRILKILYSEGVIKLVSGNARIQVYVPLNQNSF